MDIGSPKSVFNLSNNFLNISLLIGLFLGNEPNITSSSILLSSLDIAVLK